jgi:hypothetical protein
MRAESFSLLMNEDLVPAISAKKVREFIYF